ncbi:AMP-dependent synthetase/ligase [Schaalia vaccimaxillae]|uniref:AMP-dependent synthetase/ligase n=1 Tax=Schaalia vaccimaxillae TaxID=183916 RepID=UPI000425E485|nr:long-chain fatty acid--CoA ligase [Schaalia vaccimaxillae]
MAVRRLADGSWESSAGRKAQSDWNLPKMIRNRAAEHPGQIAIEKRDQVGTWRPITIDRFRDHVNDTARGLVGLGLQAGQHMAILAPTSYEWALFDMAALSCGAITVPIYETDSAAQIQHILTDANIRIVLTATSQQAELVESVKVDQTTLVLSLDRGAARIVAEAARGISQEVIDERVEALRLEDQATIIYTSGTTGIPKGVILTHANFIETAIQAWDILPFIIGDTKSRNLLFLPVAHVLARFVMYAVLSGNGVIAFSPDTRNLVDDIATFKPTMLLAVPRVLEKVYNAAAAKAGGGFKGKLFSWAARQSRQVSKSTAYVESLVEADETGGVLPDTVPVPDPSGIPSPGPSALLKVRYGVADALVLKKVRAILGPNLRTVICGGAPLALDLADFYRGLGIELLQGYGLSETTGPIAVELPEDFPPDSVGFPWPGNRMKIAEDGELLVQGVNVSPGYHNLPEETAKAFVDGWFKTGDLASIDDTGHLRITGRKKELIITAGGKNVSPGVLEESLSTHPLVANVVVVGDGRPYIGALITLDTEMLPNWLQTHGMPVVDSAAAAELPQIRASLERAIARANKQVSRAESIRRYRIVNAEFTVENGYMTPSLKLKRNIVIRDFSSEIDALYAEGEAAAKSE